MRFLKKFWPLIFIVSIWLTFSSPYFLQNKIPFASDYLVNFSPWSPYPGFSSPVKNNAMPDVIGQIVPWKTFTIDSLKNGQIPFWNPYSFSGTTHLANYQSAVLSPFNILFFLLPFVDAWSLLVLLQPLLAGIFMLIYLRSINLKNISSLFGSVAFMFCGFITAWMGYATLGYAILFLPLCLFAVEQFYKTKQFKYMFLFSLCFPLSFFSGHFQISLYFLFFVCLYLLFKFIETGNKKAAFYTFIYLFFGLLLILPQVLPSIEAYSQSLRSSIFQKTEVIPWSYIPSLFAPDLFGNPVTRNDWFGHYAEWNGFIGTVSILLSFYALFSYKNKKVLFFVSTAVITILLSFQTPLLDFLVFLKVPVLSTSAAGRIIVLFSFSAAVLASFGLEAFETDLRNRKPKKIFFWFAIICSIITSLWAVIFFKLFIPLDKVVIARQNLLLPTVFAFLLTSTIVFSLVKKGKYIFIASIFLLAILSFDMLRFAIKWQPFGPKNLFYPNIPIAKELKNIQSSERALASFGAEGSITYKAASLEGYDAVYINRYGEFISSLSSGRLQSSERSVVNLPRNGLYSSEALNLLGVKYLIHKKSDDFVPWEYPFWGNPANFKLEYEDGVYQILENLKTYPRAFLVKNYIVKTNPQDILNAMFAKDVNLRETVVLEAHQANLKFTKGSARIAAYSPNKVVVDTKTDGPALLFLSDTFYPGWKAYVDGKETTIIRADFAFRAVFVPEGVHSVEFKYLPPSFKFGLSLATLGFILMFVVLRLKGKVAIFPKI